MNRRNYGLPEIISSLIALTAIALIALFLEGYALLLTIVPAVMFALITIHGSLAEAWQTWKKMARYIVLPVNIVLLTLGFVFGVGLTALFTRLFRTKLLDVKFERRESYWVERKTGDKTLEKIQRLF